MVDFNFDGKVYNFTSGTKALSFARNNPDWLRDFGKHSKFISAYEEAAFKERNPEGYEVVDPRTKKKRWVTKEEAYTKPAVDLKTATELAGGDLTDAGLAVADPGAGPPAYVSTGGAPPQTTTKQTMVASVTDITNKNLMDSINKMDTSFNLLSEVSEETGDIDNEGEAVKMTAVLDNYIKSVDKVITAYDKQVADTMKAYYDNKQEFDRTIADKDKYTEESIAEYEKNFRVYEKSVVSAVDDYKKNSAELQSAQKSRASSIDEISDWITKVRTKTPKYTVTYIADMRERVRTFSTPEQASDFIETLNKKYVKEQGWTGTVDSFNKHVEEQRDSVSFLLSEKTITLDDDKATLAKPTTVLTNDEIIALNKIGFDKIDVTPIGPTYAAAKFFADKLDSDSWVSSLITQEATKQIATLGTFAETLIGPWQFLTSLIPGEQPLESPWRQITTDTLKYVVDLSPGQQLALDFKGMQSSAMASYLLALPIGFAAKSLTTVAGKIGSSVAYTTGWGDMFSNAALALKGKARTIALKAGATRLGMKVGSVALKIDPTKILTFLKKHPKAQQLMMYATIGVVGPDIVTTESGQLQLRLHVAEVWKKTQNRIDRGEDITKVLDDLIHNESRRIANRLGAAAGFMSGYKMLESSGMMDEIHRLEEIIEKGGKARGKFSIHRVPKSLRELFQTEVNPLTGDEIIIGVSEQGKSLLAVGRKYGDALRDLMEGKSISTEASKGAFFKYFTREDMVFLSKQGYDITKMSAQEIMTTALKELNLGADPSWTVGSPWDDILEAMEWKSIGAGKEVVNIKVLGTIASKIPDESLLGLTKAKSMFDDMTSFGVDSNTALILTQEMMMENTPMLVLKIASEAGYSDQMARKLVGYAMATGAQTASGSTMVQTLQQSGLTTTEISSVISILVQPATVDFLAGAIPTLTLASLAVVLPELDKPTVETALTKLSTTQLTRMATVLDDSTVLSIMPYLDVSAISKLMPALDQNVFIAVMPKLNPQVFDSILDNLSKIQMKSLTDVVEDLSFKQVALLLPRLDVDQLTETLMVSKYDTTSLLDHLYSAPAIQRGRWKLVRLRRNIREAKRDRRTSSLTPYKVTFRYQRTQTEIRRVKSRSFREALIVAWKLKKNPSDPSEVEVEKLKTR